MDLAPGVSPPLDPPPVDAVLDISDGTIPSPHRTPTVIPETAPHELPEEPIAGPSRRRTQSRSKSPHTSHHSETPNDAHSERSGSYESGTEYTDDEEEDDYELTRQRNITMNMGLLSQLGLGDSGETLFEKDLSTSQPPAPTNKRKRQHREVRDRSGHIITLPRPGQRQRMACVEISTKRPIRRDIDDGKYIDCENWAEGEARRWRFGRGAGGDLEEGEEAVVGGVGADFRWRPWLGQKREARRVQSLRRGIPYDPNNDPVEISSRSASPDIQVLGTKSAEAVWRRAGPQVPYSMFTGNKCHQCKRKSDKPKMTCRNVDPVCERQFCISCCRRYDYFKFDSDARSWQCPVCLNLCNCAACLRKRGLGDLVADISGHYFGRGEKSALLAGESVQEFVARSTKKAPPPFDRVRIVVQAEDIVSPPLSEEWKAYLQRQNAPPNVRGRVRGRMGIRGGRGRGGRGRGHGRPKGKGKEKEVDEEPQLVEGSTPTTDPTASSGNGESSTSAHPITLRIPGPAPREKVVDSDGDTVDGYSTDSPIPPITGAHDDRDREWFDTQMRMRRGTRSRSSTNPHTYVVNEGPATGTINDYLASLAAASSPASAFTPLPDDAIEEDAEEEAESPQQPVLDVTLPPADMATEEPAHLAVTPIRTPTRADTRFPLQTPPTSSPSLANGVPPSLATVLAPDFQASPLKAVFPPYAPEFDLAQGTSTRWAQRAVDPTDGLPPVVGSVPITAAVAVNLPAPALDDGLPPVVQAVPLEVQAEGQHSNSADQLPVAGAEPNTEGEDVAMADATEEDPIPADDTVLTMAAVVDQVQPEDSDSLRPVVEALVQAVAPGSIIVDQLPADAAAQVTEDLEAADESMVVDEPPEVHEPLTEEREDEGPSNLEEEPASDEAPAPEVEADEPPTEEADQPSTEDADEPPTADPEAGHDHPAPDDSPVDEPTPDVPTTPDAVDEAPPPAREYSPFSDLTSLPDSEAPNLADVAEPASLDPTASEASQSAPANTNGHHKGGHRLRRSGKAPAAAPVGPTPVAEPAPAEPTPPPSPIRKRRPPPPAAHIVRAPKYQRANLAPAAPAERVKTPTPTKEETRA